MKIGINQAPNTAQKARDAFNAFGVPRLDLFKRAKKHHIKPCGIGAEIFKKRIDRNHIPARLRHLLTIFSQNHALIEKLLKGLFMMNQS